MASTPVRSGAILACLSLLAPRSASAEPLAPSSIVSLPLPPPAFVSILPLARLVGAHGGGGGGRALLQPSGVYVGLDAGGALMPAAGDASTTGALAFGVHGGYRLPSGLAFDVRGDNLGVYAPAGGGLLLAAGAGMRYTVPLFVMPFAEAHLGAVSYAPGVAFAGDAAIGIAVPVGDHLELDATARDWIAGIDGAIRHVPMFTLGFAVGFDRGR